MILHKLSTTIQTLGLAVVLCADSTSTREIRQHDDNVEFKSVIFYVCEMK